ncbi:MAG TPA: hypothetical protein VFA48_11695 [Gammaproteobacteria bacterium]|nr:hypothetical protein [Gammaproteobacteria bacterium]
MIDKVNEEWLDRAKLSLEWFIETIGEKAWIERRRGVIQYFTDLFEQQFSSNGIRPLSPSQPFRPMAMYDDWMAWYMYLVECLRERPACDEPMQSSRIFPFFSAIGREIKQLRNSKGVSERLQNLLSQQQNQPDSVLYELVVAACYVRNGWSIEFLEEKPPLKNPDLLVRKDDRQIFVECKRFSKTSSYAERERQAWLERWNPLCALFKQKGLSVHAHVVFKEPVESLPKDCLIRFFLELINPRHLASEELVENSSIAMRIRYIDMKAVRAHFEKWDVRNGSPQLIALLAGEYEPLGSYTHAFSPSEYGLIGPDDGLHACNGFIGGIHFAASARWECVATEATNAKARDVTKMLSKAVAQAPEGAETCIHIGYETLDSPQVELVRHAKIVETVRSFDYSGKSIHSLFFNAMQPIARINGFECAETTAYFSVCGEDSRDILGRMLLLDPQDGVGVQSTHWWQDIAATE